MSETKETKTSRKSVLIALGIICIVLVACLGGVVATYTLMINDKNNTISSLNYQISQLNSTVANLTSLVAKLQNPLNDTVGGFNEQLGLLLTMTLQKTDYSLGEPVNMTFTITNISNQTIGLDYYVPYNFEFQVFNDTNNSIGSLIYPVYAYNPGGPAIFGTFLNPEESLTGVLVWEQTCNNTIFSEGVPVSSGTYYIVGQIGPIFLNGLTIETTPIQIVIA